MRELYSVSYSSPVSTGAYSGRNDSANSQTKAGEPALTVGVTEPEILEIAILPPILKPIVTVAHELNYVGESVNAAITPYS